MIFFSLVTQASIGEGSECVCVVDSLLFVDDEAPKTGGRSIMSSDGGGGAMRLEACDWLQDMAEPQSAPGLDRGEGDCATIRRLCAHIKSRDAVKTQKAVSLGKTGNGDGAPIVRVSPSYGVGVPGLRGPVADTG